jgi:hypothetical protein
MPAHVPSLSVHTMTLIYGNAPRGAAVPHA